MCKPDSDGQFNEYMLYADVTFKNGYVTGISGFSSEDESNKPYYTKAANGNKKYKGVVEQMVLRIFRLYLVQHVHQNHLWKYTNMH